MMNLYLDNIVFSLQQAGGISVVWSELVKRMLDDPDITVRFIDIPNRNIFRKRLSIPGQLKLKNPLGSIPMPLQRYINPGQIPGSGIFHSSYYRTANPRAFANVTTVHDFTYEYFRSGPARLIHSLQKAAAIRRAHRIICVSENTRADVLKFFPGTDENKIRVIYNGVDSAYGRTERNDQHIKQLVPWSTGEYAIFVGDRKSNHKNFNVAVKACLQSATPLLIVGGGPLTKHDREWLTSMLGPAHFLQVSGTSNHHLNLLYNHALCLLYPSSYEGFGIPVIEAQKAGCPVITTRLSSLPEVAGEGAIFIDQIHKDAIADIIRQLKSRSYPLHELIAAGLLNAQRFSWDRCYSQTKQLYGELA